MSNSISIDTRPFPYLVIPLKCPLCNCVLRSDFTKGFGEVHVHKFLAVGTEGCANEGRKFVVGHDLQVRELL